MDSALALLRSVPQARWTPGGPSPSPQFLPPHPPEGKTTEITTTSVGITHNKPLQVRQSVRSGYNLEILLMSPS